MGGDGPAGQVPSGARGGGPPRLEGTPRGTLPPRFPTAAPGSRPAHRALLCRWPPHHGLLESTAPEPEQVTVPIHGRCMGNHHGLLGGPAVWVQRTRPSPTAVRPPVAQDSLVELLPGWRPGPRSGGMAGSHRPRPPAPRSHSSGSLALNPPFPTGRPGRYPLHPSRAGAPTTGAADQPSPGPGGPTSPKSRARASAASPMAGSQVYQLIPPQEAQAPV